MSLPFITTEGFLFTLFFLVFWFVTWRSIRDL